MIKICTEVTLLSYEILEFHIYFLTKHKLYIHDMFVIKNIVALCFA